MYTTEFLPHNEHWRYGDWLQEQDPETLHMYFGISGGQGLVESLMLRIEAQADAHEFLVAKNCTGWLGPLHIAEIDNKKLEFGVIVRQDLRGVGIGSDLIEQGIVFARNRGYEELYMQCLSHNLQMLHLCDKHGLQPRHHDQESQVAAELPPATWITLTQEIMLRQRNQFYMSLRAWPGFAETLG